MEAANQVIQGDVNRDNTVNIINALMIAQYYGGLEPDGFDPQGADVNCDTMINIIDALIVARFYVGILNQLDC